MKHSRQVAALVLLTLLSGVAEAKDEAVRHGPYARYLITQVTGPTFEGPEIPGRGVYLDQSSTTQGYSVGYLLMQELAKTQGAFAAGGGLAFSQWATSDWSDFSTPPGPSISGDARSDLDFRDPQIDYWFIDLLVQADLWYFALYGGFGVGSVGLAFNGPDGPSSRGQISGNWFAGLRISPLTIATAIATGGKTLEHRWAKTFDLAFVGEYRSVPGAEHCEGYATTERCGGDTVQDTDSATLLSVGLGLMIDIGSL